MSSRALVHTPPHAHETVGDGPAQLLWFGRSCLPSLPSTHTPPLPLPPPQTYLISVMATEGRSTSTSWSPLRSHRLAYLGHGEGGGAGTGEGGGAGWVQWVGALVRECGEGAPVSRTAAPHLLSGPSPPPGWGAWLCVRWGQPAHVWCAPLTPPPLPTPSTHTHTHFCKYRFFEPIHPMTTTRQAMGVMMTGGMSSVEVRPLLELAPPSLLLTLLLLLLGPGPAWLA